MAKGQRKRHFRFIVVAIICGTALGGIIAESLLRVMGRTYGTAPLDPHPIFHHWHPANFGFEAWSQTGEYGGFRVQFNGAGMASARELPRQPESAILVLGDSFVEGLNVAEQERLSAVIERETGITTLNFGCSSFSPLLSRLLFDAFRDRVRAVAVVEVVYSNDVADDQLYKQYGVQDGRDITAVPGQSDSWSRLVLVTRRSYLARFIRNTWQRYRLRQEFEGRLGRAQFDAAWFPVFNKPLTVTEPSDHLRFTERNLELLAENARRAGADFYLTTVPDRGSALQGQNDFLNDYMKRFAERVGIAYVDLVPAFKAAGVRSLFHHTNIHWNRDGQALAGHLIAEQILADRSALPEIGQQAPKDTTVESTR